MENRLHAFLVTADAALIETHKGWLAQVADLAVYRSATECREGLGQRVPDLVMIDFDLPDGEGLDLHRALRDDFDTCDVFQLALCQPDALAQEDFSADDQLFKPVDPRVLQRKWTQIEKRFTEAANARSQLSYAQGVALTAMSSMGELGVVMQFLSRSFTCHSISSVASLTLDALRQYDLTGVVDIQWEGGELLLSTDGSEVSASTRTLIAQRRTLGRLLEIDTSLVVNFPHVSILISNLPVDDSQRCGRIRDNIATLAEGVESRVLGLLMEHTVLLKRQGIRYAVCEIRDSVSNLNGRQLADLEQTRSLVNQVIDEFEEAFMQVGMETQVENVLINRLVDLRHSIGDIVSRPGEVHEKLQVVVNALETLAGKVGDEAGEGLG